MPASSYCTSIVLLHSPAVSVTVSDQVRLTQILPVMIALISPLRVYSAGSEVIISTSVFKSLV